MAPEIGQALREARTERGIELSEVERVTKIRIRFLRAMEEDRWEALPGPAYARGFLSAYARFLGLDDQALVDQYRKTVEGVDRAEPIPYKVLQPGVGRRRRSTKIGRRRRSTKIGRRSRSTKVGRRSRLTKPVAILITGLVAAVLLGLVIVGSLGGSGNGGDRGDHRGGTAAGSAAIKTPTGQLPTAPVSEMSLALRATGTVWVCLVDREDRALVNGETLTADEVRGPFDSRGFEVTFGNGSVEMTVDGEPAKIPPVAEPLGYRITSSGVRRLDPSSRPTCL